MRCAKCRSTASSLKWGFDEKEKKEKQQSYLFSANHMQMVSLTSRKRLRKKKVTIQRYERRKEETLKQARRKKSKDKRQTIEGG